jgi:hypothetical protein
MKENKKSEQEPEPCQNGKFRNIAVDNCMKVGIAVSADSSAS